MAGKMPRESHALFVIADGKVLNPEFVVWDRDSYREELWKWKRKGVRVDGRNVEFIAKHGQTYERININAV
jgi:hypothetical protein